MIGVRCSVRIGCCVRRSVRIVCCVRRSVRGPRSPLREVPQQPPEGSTIPSGRFHPTPREVTQSPHVGPTTTSRRFHNPLSQVPQPPPQGGSTTVLREVSQHPQERFHSSRRRGSIGCVRRFVRVGCCVRRFVRVGCCVRCSVRLACCVQCSVFGPERLLCSDRLFGLTKCSCSANAVRVQSCFLSGFLLLLIIISVIVI